MMAPNIEAISGAVWYKYYIIPFYCISRRETIASIGDWRSTANCHFRRTYGRWTDGLTKLSVDVTLRLRLEYVAQCSQHCQRALRVLNLCFSSRLWTMKCFRRGRISIIELFPHFFKHSNTHCPSQLQRGPALPCLLHQSTDLIENRANAM